MADLSLSARSAASGLNLPLQIGNATLSEAPAAAMASVMPLGGRAKEVSDSFKPLIGMDLPEPGYRAATGKAELIWMGLDQWFVRGLDIDPLANALGSVAALTDQSDAWAVLDLGGEDAIAVLARLCPLDLDPQVFPPGRTARTEFAHMMASVTALEEGFRIMVMRSFAGTAIHDLSQAMRSVDAQATLRPSS